MYFFNKSFFIRKMSYRGVYIICCENFEEMFKRGNEGKRQEEEYVLFMGVWR